MIIRILTIPVYNDQQHRATRIRENILLLLPTDTLPLNGAHFYYYCRFEGRALCVYLAQSLYNMSI